MSNRDVGRNSSVGGSGSGGGAGNNVNPHGYDDNEAAAGGYRDASGGYNGLNLLGLSDEAKTEAFVTQLAARIAAGSPLTAATAAAAAAEPIAVAAAPARTRRRRTATLATGRQSTLRNQLTETQGERDAALARARLLEQQLADARQAPPQIEPELSDILLQAKQTQNDYSEAFRLATVPNATKDQLRQALALYEKVEKSSPQNSPHRINSIRSQAIVYSTLDLFDQASTHYNRSIDLDYSLGVVNPNTLVDRGLLLRKMPFTLANNKIAIQDFKRALKIFARLPALKPLRPIPFIRAQLASCYEKSHEINKELEQYNLIIDAEPTNYITWLNKGINLKDQGNYLSAIAAFDQAINLSDPLLAYIHKIISLLELSKFQECQDLINNIVNKITDNTEENVAYRHKQNEKFPALLLNTSEGRAQLTVQMTSLQARLYKKQAEQESDETKKQVHYEKAIELYNSFLSQDALMSRMVNIKIKSLQDLEQIYKNSNNTNKQKEYLDQLINLNNPHSTVEQTNLQKCKYLSRRALLFYNQDNNELACQDFNNALNLNPKEKFAIQFFIQRAESLLTSDADSSKYKFAIEYFKLAQRVSSDNQMNRELHIRIADCYAKLNEHLRAKDEYTKILDLNAEDKDALQKRGMANFKLGLHLDALIDLNKVPAITDVDFYRAECYYALGQYSEAHQLFHNTDLSGPEFKACGALLLTRRGELKMLCEEREDYSALIDLTAALLLNPQNIHTLNWLSHGYIDTNYIDEGLKYAIKAYTLATANLDAANQTSDADAKKNIIKAQLAESHYNAGRAQFMLGNYADAIAELTNAKTFFQTNTNSPYYLDCLDYLRYAQRQAASAAGGSAAGHSTTARLAQSLLMDTSALAAPSNPANISALVAVAAAERIVMIAADTEALQQARIKFNKFVASVVAADTVNDVMRNFVKTASRSAANIDVSTESVAASAAGSSSRKRKQPCTSTTGKFEDSNQKNLVRSEQVSNKRKQILDQMHSEATEKSRIPAYEKQLRDALAKAAAASDSTKCHICVAENRNTFFTPCGHNIVGEQCAQRICCEEGGKKECPICRTPVTGFDKFFLCG